MRNTWELNADLLPDVFCGRSLIAQRDWGFDARSGVEDGARRHMPRQISAASGSTCKLSFFRYSGKKPPRSMGMGSKLDFRS